MMAQPYIDITSGGFGINVWGNMDIDDDYNDTLHTRTQTFTGAREFHLVFKGKQVKADFLSYAKQPDTAEIRRGI